MEVDLVRFIVDGIGGEQLCILDLGFEVICPRLAARTVEVDPLHGGVAAVFVLQRAAVIAQIAEQVDIGIALFLAVILQQGVEAADYLGSWGCDRCVITISPNGSDYVANIEWKTGGGETLTHTKWTYDLTYDNSIAAMVCNSGGTCKERVDMSDGTYTENTRYTDGTAMFVMREGMLRWSDNKEDIANGMCFYN